MRIKRITSSGLADVFNVTVQDAHTFVANHGFVTHNCDELRYMCMSRPITPVTEREAEPIFFDPLNQFKRNPLRQGA